MPVMNVTKVGKARSGKPLVYFDNRHSQTDAYIVSDGVTVPAERMTIDAQTKSWEYRGTTYWGLEDWKEVKAAPPQSNGKLPTIDAPAKTLAGWDLRPEEMCRFVSNVVGQAIAAGVIKRPSQVYAWSSVAYRAAEGLKGGAMPQADVLPDPNEDQDRDPDDGDRGYSPDDIR